MYRGTPAQFFFFSLLTQSFSGKFYHFQANSIKGETLPKIVQDGLASKVIIQAFYLCFPLPFKWLLQVVSGMRKFRIDQDFLIEHWHMIYIMPVVFAEIYF